MSCHPGGCKDHNHEEDIEPMIKESLLGYIDLENVRCLNESVPNSIRDILKPWEERDDKEKYLESDCDEQLLIYIPFTGSVKLKSISLKVGAEGHAPSKMKVFINHDYMDFDLAEQTEPLQTWDLVQGYEPVVEYNTRISKFNRVRSLTLFFPSNYGEETTILYFLGLRGEFSQVNKDPVITIYEVQPNVKDHKVPGIGELNNHQIG